jgi:hypothetical protein
MLSRNRLLLAFAVAAALASILVNAAIGMRNWSNVKVGQSRDAVHATLGSPDASFLAKGWEGWDHSGIVGAWVLVVHYDESNTTVTYVKRKFDWGLGYLLWDRDHA